MFFGIFILMSGVLYLCEVFGLISADIKWGLPLALICFGASEAWKAYSSRQPSTNQSPTS
ncbi:hypothetical protein AO738_12365 [Pseudomonas citronellolis]|nr:hypothetical protein AO742_15350 [Pseudomonas citronellolis]KRW78606.1 hypothetical protein AO738_12365 [Pseudomonas citronellolis]